MVDSPTPRHTPHNMNPFLLYITAVNLLKGVLISANNNGRLIDIEEQEVVGVAKVSQGKFSSARLICGLVIPSLSINIMVWIDFEIQKSANSPCDVRLNLKKFMNPS